MENLMIVLINSLKDILVCSIAECFNESCKILATSRNIKRCYTQMSMLVICHVVGVNKTFVVLSLHEAELAIKENNSQKRERMQKKMESSLHFQIP